ncbi:AGL009Cp [Eremothecium gossypii ATCC 10895]|uniref:AGL009Cp n=1 Tax=Eremothecium gossypii (strain ATCC 10895 / CBS 109.51 / FGSC 9923 / NRRL Y-1056) TaxID=284811 RepID=Q750G2_EREGS|nr:AGL009Cp [Eremothecium gossypii ATCC 10895]AAS54481.2 AGL009Cp [Eremothecium gossypii ATCC 10895]AEY98813.1 FAGL009Cp [Eremothecium gossypii FDAG1]
MKILRDLVIPRKELQHWTDNLTWAKDGTLYVTTIPDVTCCEPVFSREINGQAKQLFYTKEFPLELGNKFEYDLAERDVLLNAQPEPGVVMCAPSPSAMQLAILTNNANVITTMGQTCVGVSDERTLSEAERAYRAVCWGPDGRLLVVGNECGELKIFSVRAAGGGASVGHLHTVSVGGPEEWVVGIRWKGDMIVAYTSANSVHMVSAVDYKHQELLGASRRQVTDVQLVGKHVLVARMDALHKIDYYSGQVEVLALGWGTESYIVPLPDQEAAVVLCNRTSCKVLLDGPFEAGPDDVIAPHIETKFKKWNTVFNEFNKYETTFNIYGVALSPDGYCLAILYEIERVSFKYRILSELQFRIMFLPLTSKWRITPRATGLALYQNYHIYNGLVPENLEETQSIDFSTKQEFALFLEEIRNSEQVSKLRFQNLLRDSPSDEWYKRLLYKYALDNRDRITNPLDKACVISLANILKVPAPFTSTLVTLKGEYVTESFNFSENDDPRVLKSEDGTLWQRCAITYLPLLTASVKVCPVSNHRIIDIRRDTYNDYGWLTRTLLEVFNDESLYTGTRMTTI